MFCPRCATENDAKLSYCRQCGLQMKAVRLAFEGHVDEATAAFKKGHEAVASGLLTFSIFLMIAIIAGIFFGGSTMIANVIIGLIFGVPQVVSGLKKLSKVDRLLDSKSEPACLPASHEQSAARLPAAPITDRISSQLPGAQLPNSQLPAPGSVTEHTTLDLKPPDATRNR